MQYRKMGRLGWSVSEIGYGMSGIARGLGNLAGANHETPPICLDAAVEAGCNFFDTTWAYDRGIGEKMLGRLLRSYSDRRLYVATKIPPKTREWPRRPHDRLEDVFPAAHIREYTERSLENLGMQKIDLLQFQVWEDRWAEDESWQREIAELRLQGLIGGVGISANRWEPANCLKAIDTGLIDVIQVVYNIFDQAPEDSLFRVAQKKNIGIIARVPFDQGGLTGRLTKAATFAPGDGRGTYFGPENLGPTAERADALKRIVPRGSTLPELALRFVLHHPAVSTVIPGMRQLGNVRINMALSDGRPLAPALLTELRRHRWDRQPTAWSQ